MDLDEKTIKKKHKKKHVVKFDEPLEQPGTIFLAEIHGSAQHLLKVKKLSKYIRFCQCCLLPSETPGVVMPYTCLDNRKDFGIGLHLYFYYIQFCLIMTAINFVLSSLPTMIFSIRYSNHLKDHCRAYYFAPNDTYNNSNDSNIDSYLSTNITNCLKYLSMENSSKISENIGDIITTTDWILKMSADNLENYYEIFKNKAEDSTIIEDIPLNFSFLYFLASLTLLIINFFFIQYINILIQKEDFEDTSPKDFTIIVHNVHRPNDNENISRKQVLKDILTEISDNYFKLEVYDIIPCYNLNKLYKLTKKIYEDRVKIYHAHNFKRQKILHEKYMDSQRKNNSFNYLRGGFFEQNKNIPFKGNESGINTNSQASIILSNNNLNPKDNNNNQEPTVLNYYTNYFFFIKATPLSKIEKRIEENKKKLTDMEKDLLMNPNKYNCGTFFVIFKYISMRDKVYDFFPTTFSSRIFANIKYLFQNCLCGCCVNKKTQRINYLRTAFTIEKATEAYEVQWQNMGYSMKEKALYLSISVFVTILLIGASLSIVIGLNEAQYALTKNDENTFLKYLLSFLISITISLINYIARCVLKIITDNFEAIETRTDYYTSTSIKISIFTFINTAIIPLLSNYIRHEWGNNDILLNNILMIFITNIALAPFVFYFNPELCIKLSRRAKARMDLEGVSVVDSTYTQGELNELFENPEMDLSVRYSFFVNTLLTSFFYMSIFPIGTIFCIFALILSYFFEIFYLGFYKRPEEISGRLCKFFIQNFKVVISIFAVGNYIFLFPVRHIYGVDWSLINLILFIIIAFIPYHTLRLNLLGVTEGEVVKGSYDEYSLMFPTDYEKENPLTKTSAMIKHFKKLEAMNIIDKYQSEYLINNVKKESIMDTYYKNSRNVGNILKSFEFQRQFIKLKRKYKFIKEVRRKKDKLNKYDINIDDEYKRRGFSLQNKQNSYKQSPSLKKKETDNTSNNKANKLGYSTHALVDKKKYKKKGASDFMRQTLFNRIKDEGIYSDSEEESEEESDIGSFSESVDNDKKEKNEKNSKISVIQENTSEEEEDTSSIDTENKAYYEMIKNNMRKISSNNNLNPQDNEHEQEKPK